MAAFYPAREAIGGPPFPALHDYHAGRAEPMRIFVHSDLEGAAMVFRFDQCGETGDPRKAGPMRILTGEVNACVDGILDEAPGAEVVVMDGHGTGGIDYETFTDKATLIAGKDRGAHFLGDGFDALFIVGQHAMEGTEGACLPHTFSSREIEQYKLNGRPVGEFGMHALRAGTVYGMPTAFVSGDDKAVAEAQALVPGLVGVATKTGLSREAARSLAPARAQALVREGAREAVRRVKAGRVKPVRIDPPYVLEVRVKDGMQESLLPYLARGAERQDERTVVIRTDDPRAVLRGMASVSV